jgi:hypothetical protein
MPENNPTPERHPGRNEPRRFPESPAKLAGDRDEAKALPEDITVRRAGSPDADLHHPAAAPADTDGEAGLDRSGEGRIEPLKPARK